MFAFYSIDPKVAYSCQGTFYGAFILKEDAKMDINNLIVWLFTLLGILVAVLIAKWNTYSKESNKKILRWRFNILT